MGRPRENSCPRCRDKGLDEPKVPGQGYCKEHMREVRRASRNRIRADQEAEAAKLLRARWAAELAESFREATERGTLTGIGPPPEPWVSDDAIDLLNRQSDEPVSGEGVPDLPAPRP